MIGPLHFPNNQKSNVFQLSTTGYMVSSSIKNESRHENVNLHQVVLKFSLHSRFHVILGNPEGANQSEKKTPILVIELLKKVWLAPEEKEDDLHPADDGKASEESHGASNETQLGLRLDLLVSLNVIKGRRVELDLHYFQS